MLGKGTAALSKNLPLVIPCMLLSIISLLLLWSIDSQYFTKQLVFWLISWISYFLLVQPKFRLDDLENFSLPIFAGIVFFLVLPLIFGQVIRGSSRWIFIKELSIQPSEFIKPLYVISLASIVSKIDLARLKSFVIVVAMIVFPALLVLAQPDLGSALQLLATGGLILIFSKVKKSWLIFLSGVGLLATFLGWNFLIADYQKERVSYFLHPEKDPLGKGYNAIQVKITVGSGSFFGNGLGQGGQTRLAFLPERHTDFIFATLAESFGFAGIIVVVSLYFLIFWHIYRILAATDNDYHYLIILGIGFYLWIQLTINIGMNLGILPITGLALPLFSSGGSSLLSTMIGLGLISKSQA